MNARCLNAQSIASVTVLRMYSMMMTVRRNVLRVCLRGETVQRTMRLTNVLNRSGFGIDIHTVHRGIATMPVYKPADGNLKRDVQEQRMTSPCNKASRIREFRPLSSHSKIMLEVLSCLPRVGREVSIVEVMVWARRTNSLLHIYTPSAAPGDYDRETGKDWPLIPLPSRQKLVRPPHENWIDIEHLEIPDYNDCSELLDR